MKRILFILLLALLPSYAFAKESSESNHPCREDVKKFCAAVKPGHGAVMKCMKEHEKELSPDCLAKTQEWKEKRREKRAERSKRNS